MSLKLDMTEDMAPRIMVTIKVVGIKRWVIRLWVAKQLFKLAGRITNMGIKFEEQPWYSADL